MGSIRNTRVSDFNAPPVRICLAHSGMPLLKLLARRDPELYCGPVKTIPKLSHLLLPSSSRRLPLLPFHSYFLLPVSISLYILPVVPFLLCASNILTFHPLPLSYLLPLKLPFSTTTLPSSTTSILLPFLTPPSLSFPSLVSPIRPPPCLPACLLLPSTTRIMLVYCTRVIKADNLL